MLSKLVVRLYSILLEIALWLMLIAGAVIGFEARGFVGGLIGLVIAAIFGAVLLGAFLVLDDIRKKVNAIEKHGTRKT